MDQGYSISADAFGNAFVTGSFQNLTIYFGSNIVYNNGGPCFHGCTDAFLVKYDANGNVLWAKDAGGIADDEGYCVSTDPSGEVYLTGGFNSSGGIFYGTLTPILSWPYNALDPMFFIKCDANGNLLCAAALASGGDDLNGVSADLFGNAYVTGDYFLLVSNVS